MGKPDNSEAKVKQLYKIIQSNLYMVEPNDQGELDIGSPTFIGCNSESDLYG